MPAGLAGWLGSRGVSVAGGGGTGELETGARAGAAGWVGWTVLMPNEWRGALRTRWHRALGRTPAPTAGCGNCGCGADEPAKR